MGLPSHLSGPDATGIRRDEPIAQYELGNQRNFVYLVLDWKMREAAIVDPQKDLAPPLSDLSENGFALKAVLLTHTHFDHIAGVPELARRFPGLPVYVHEADRHRIKTDAAIRAVSDGMEIPLGKTTIEVLHTPGHSAGECCFLVRAERPSLLTGDTVFIRDCGRTDLETGSTAELFASLQRIKKLPKDTIILPGHHYQAECASTLEKEMRESPPFRCQNVAELEALP